MLDANLIAADLGHLDDSHVRRCDTLPFLASWSAAGVLAQVLIVGLASSQPGCMRARARGMSGANNETHYKT